MKNSKSDNQSKTDLYYGGHLVAFIDILGQSRNLSRLKKVAWWQLNEETLTVLKKTYGRVLRFRKNFQAFLASFSKPSALDSAFKDMTPPDDIKIWDQFSQSRIIYQGLSDSLIMTFPLLITDGVIPLKSVYGVLGACASSMLNALNCKFAVRGAIEIGPCILHPKTKEVYGSALNDAVKYEKQADWPRILIGPELVGYLESCLKLPQDSKVNQINSEVARRCLSLIAQDESGIAQDESGLFFLDYLSPRFSELRNLKDYDRLINGALKFVNDQIHEFRNDEKLYYKYIKLQEYFLTRNDTTSTKRLHKDRS